jgi:peptidoglycan hydrolase-like protein with peptidoglycan-binding domain
MPRVMQLRNAGKMTLAYTVDHAVGPGCSNQRPDVLLVQHLLRLAWNDVPSSKGFRPPGEAKPLGVDGLYGPTTQRFIKFFQEEAKRRGAHVLLDGKVDAVVSGGSHGSISQSYYTALAMNAARNNRCPVQADIAADPNFPAELTRHFFVDYAKQL